MTTKPIHLIGAPTDIGAGARGASMGPEALRVAGLAAALRGFGLDVIDTGNLVGAPIRGYRRMRAIVTSTRYVRGISPSATP